MVLVVVVAAQVGLELAGVDGPGWLAALFAGYTFTSRSPSMTPRRILLVTAGVVVPITVVSLALGHNPLTFVPGLVFVALVMIVGDRVRRGRELEPGDRRPGRASGSSTPPSWRCRTSAAGSPASCTTWSPTASA